MYVNLFVCECINMSMCVLSMFVHIIMLMFHHCIRVDAVPECIPVSYHICERVCA